MYLIGIFPFWCLDLSLRLNINSFNPQQIKSMRYFGVQTFVELLCHHKRQIPGVGQNVYVWQLNAVLPTTGLILHSANWRWLKKAKGDSNGSGSQVPCLRLPADALSLDAPSWCSTPPPTPPTTPGTVTNLLYAQNVLSCATEPDESTPVSYQVGGEHARNMW